ncbi:MAG: DUF4126 domain-containing protein [Chloroflexi bacterium]|nr:MAG: DUF4126 domain-containing protein [Chloroflexota bacterium]
MNIGTGYGLAFSSGINAYLPLLSFSISARFFHLYKVNPNFSYITQDWFMIALAILTLVDIFADKIPVVDHVWDMIHTVLRPIAGAIVAAASQEQLTGPGLPVVLVLGAGLAGMVHTTKATTRVAATAMTAGFLNTVMSIVEDIIVVLTTALSLLMPVVMVMLLIVFVGVFLFVVPRVVRVLRRRRYRGKSRTASLSGEGS